MSTTVQPFKTSWVIDSGASDHIISIPDSYITAHPLDGVYVDLPNSQQAKTTLIGRVQITEHFFLDDVLYVPGFSYNMLSVSKLADQTNCLCLFTSTHCFIQDPQQRMIGSGARVGGLYMLKTSPVLVINQVHVYKVELWHQLLGHLPMRKLNILKIFEPTIDCNKDIIFDVCHLAKQHRLPFIISDNKTSAIYELIHIDIWGPFSSTTYHGYKYFFTIVDDFSKSTWVYLLHNKSEVGSYLQKFCKYVARQFGVQVKIVQSDQGREFTMPSFYAETCILHQVSCVYTPQQNGVVERKHQYILNVARSLHFQAG